MEKEQQFTPEPKNSAQKGTEKPARIPREVKVKLQRQLNRLGYSQEILLEAVKQQNRNYSNGILREFSYMCPIWHYPHHVSFSIFLPRDRQRHPHKGWVLPAAHSGALVGERKKEQITIKIRFSIYILYFHFPV